MLTTEDGYHTAPDRRRKGGHPPPRGHRKAGACPSAYPTESAALAGSAQKTGTPVSAGKANTGGKVCLARMYHTHVCTMPFHHAIDRWIERSIKSTHPRCIRITRMCSCKSSLTGCPKINDNKRYSREFAIHATSKETHRQEHCFRGRRDQYFCCFPTFSSHP